MSTLPRLLAVLLLGACSSPELAGLAASSTGTDETAGTGTGDPCTAAGQFEVLGQCYGPSTITEVQWAVSVAAADFDGDGATELVTTCQGTDSTWGLCLAELGGAVVKTDIEWLASGDGQVHAGDFDADGVEDVLVSEMYHFAIFSIDAGGFVEKSSLTYSPDEIEVADAVIFPAIPMDVDQDGRAEVVAGSGFNGVRLWRFDQTQERWAPAGDRLPLFGCGDLADARVVDVNGDARADLVALGSHNNCDANLAPGSQWNRVSVFTGEPNAGELVPLADFAAELPARRLDVADLGEDDVPDLVVADATDMMVFRGHGDGSFTPPVPAKGLARFVGTGPHAGDIDGDGIDELTVEQDGGSYHVLVGMPAPQIISLPSSMRLIRLVADLNGDGRADFVSAGASSDGLPLIVSLSAP